MRYLKFLPGLVALSCLLFYQKSTAQTCTGNLLQNPGFESGLTGWEGGGEQVIGGSSGTYSLRICPLGQPVRQTVAATAGSAYTFSGKVVTSNGTVNQIQFGIKFLSATWQVLASDYGSSNYTNNGWTDFSLPKTAPAGTAWAEVSFQKIGQAGTNDCVFTDDACLTKSGGGTGGGQPDLTISNLQLNGYQTQAGKVISYRFDLANPSMTAVLGNFSVKAYISTDDILSADDIQDGIVPTGNFAAGISVPQILGATTVPATLAPGNYFIILKVDADNQVAESNEANNLVVSTSPLQVLAGTGGSAGACEKFVGNGQLVCAQPVTGSTNAQMVIDGGGQRIRTTYSPVPALVSTENLGAVATTSVQEYSFEISGTTASLVKRNLTGAVVYTKNLPAATVNSLAQFHSATEFGTGYVILGTKNAAANPAYYIDSLFALKTDANLNIILKKYIGPGNGQSYGNYLGSLVVVGPDRLAYMFTQSYFSTSNSAFLRLIDGNLIQKSEKSLYQNVWSAGAAIQKNLCRGFTVTDQQGLGYCKSGGCFIGEYMDGEFVNDQFVAYNSAKVHHQTQVGIGFENYDYFTQTTDGGSIKGERYLTGNIYQSTNDTIVLKKYSAANVLLWTKKVKVPEPGFVKKIVESGGEVYFIKQNYNSDWSVVSLSCLENVPPPILPDLLIGAFITPATATVNSPQTAQIFYQNAGTAAVGSHTYSLYLGSSPTFSVQMSSLLGSFTVNSLAVGESGSNSINFTAPAFVGNYYLFAVADVSGSVAELSESNNAKGNPYQLLAPAGITVSCPADMVFSECPQSSTGVACLNCHTIVPPTATTTCTGGTTVVFDSYTILSASTGGTPMSINPTGPFGLVTIGFGSAQVKFKITDGCGNTQYCSYKITNNYIDPTPTTVCPANITVTAAAGATTAIVNYTQPSKTSPCLAYIPGLTAGLNSGSAFPIGTTTVTWTFSLANGIGSSSCTFTVTVLAGSTGGGCTTNLLQNPSFENNLTNWEGTGGTISTTASAGTKSVKLCQNGTVRQTIATSAGKNLSFLFKARTETTGADKVLSYIKYLSSTWQPLVTEYFDFSTTATFAQGTVSKTAPTGAAWAEVGFLKQTTGCVLVDEVCLSEGGTAPTLPDLVVLSGATATFVPTTSTTAPNVQVNLTVKNNGTGASGAFNVAAIVSLDNVENSGDQYGFTNVPALAAGASLAITVNVPVTSISSATGGQYMVLLKADYNLQVAESNETNNAGSAQNVVLPQTQPEITSRPCYPLFTSNSYLHYDTMLVGESIKSPSCGFTVYNMTGALSFVQKFYISKDNVFSSDDVLVLTESLVNLTPNIAPTTCYSEAGLTNSSGTIPASVQTGKYFIFSKMDADNQVSEWDESNNVTMYDHAITIIGATNPASCATNLLQNPSFENNLTNWEGTGGVVSATASAGTKSVKLCQNGTIRQTIATSAGKNLSLLFKARTETTGADKVLSYIKYLSASWQPLVTEYFDFSTTAVFGQGTVSKTAPTGAAWAEIGFLKQTAGCVLVDEVCLSEGGGAVSTISMTCPADVVADACPSFNSGPGPVCNVCSTVPVPTATTACASGGLTVAFDGFTVLTPAPSGYTNIFVGNIPNFGLRAQGFGTAEVRFKATDACGNTKICTYKITTNLIDPTPVFTYCPPNVTVTAAAGATGAVVTYQQPQAISSCGNMTIDAVQGFQNLNSGAVFPLGTSTNALKATNLVSNVATYASTCQWNTTVVAGSANLPDLSVLAHTFPATVTAGQSITASITVKNGGTASTGLPFKAGFRIGQTATPPQGGGAPIVDIVFPNIIGANGSDLQGTTFTMLSPLTPGNYFLYVVADVNGVVTESNEANNFIVAPITVTGGTSTGADLKITLTADKTTVPQWGNVTYTVTAKNEGTSPISSAVVKIGGCEAGVFKFFDQAYKLVFAGTPGAPTSGSFNFISQEWTLTNLAAGAQGVLTIPLFTTGTAEKKVAAWAKSQSPTDPDSQPSASIFAGCTPVQDDEAIWTINLGQSLTGSAGRSVPEIGIRNSDRIFPNPAGETLTLNMADFLEKEGVQVSIFNDKGLIVKTLRFDKIDFPTEEISLDGFQNGLYFVRFIAPDLRPVTVKLAVQRTF